MINEKGNLSINSENILPIIKKWLYSDTDIFLRELVSNGVDAITKLNRLEAAGEAETAGDEFYVKVTLDKEAGTVVVSDNGIGMSADEVMRYINQIAFSGATEFVERYSASSGADIIGHFGLGFYSAFMVAQTVCIDTKSYNAGEPAVCWRSEGGVGFEMTDSDKTERGTEITLYIGDDSKEFLDEYRLRGILRKYCSYMPVDIFFETAGEKANEEAAEEAEEDEADEGNDGASEDTKQKPSPINNRSPLWNRKPGDCTDEEYKEFYHKAFTDFNDPLFWIHLNMDYPFRLKGILYFPKLSHELESIEGQVKLYNNQVFIAENIKEVIPEFLLLLKGVIDCPDLPLNVSRSALQNDGFVTRMSSYIIKKVADRITDMHSNEREEYNKYWDDISPFIKYGCLRENDFYEKVKDALLFKTTKGEHLSAREYLDKNTEKTDNRIVYVTDEKQQAQYLMLTDEQGVDAVMMGTRIDNPFMSYIESRQMADKLKFIRIDSDISSIFKDSGEAGNESGVNNEYLTEFFKKTLGKEKLEVKAETLKNSQVPAIVVLSEEGRRMQEMAKMFKGMDSAMFGAMDSGEVLILNTGNDLVKRLADTETENPDAALICAHLYDLAVMSHRSLSAEDMNNFVARSCELMVKLM
ncbi:MAG: molecular chaperone HtpG [Defluviitaleaceae bacterium]|nr:molecular chaperone HtpG [Defluviitaleaceae bacterium]MCL2835702.1 molecular chaperone HtpG [Defluviitaleaceae bacterium]